MRTFCEVTNMANANSVPVGKKGYRLLRRTEVLNGMVNVDLASIEKFKELHGHLFIKKAFAFDSGTPDVGYRAGDIGEHVKRIRHVNQERPELIRQEDRERLDELGFVWKVGPAALQRLIEGVTTYRAIYGTFSMPVAFTVPQDDLRWSPKLWGFTLGDHYRNLLDKQLPAEERELLEKSGIPTKKQRIYDRVRADTLLLALRIFKATILQPSISAKQLQYLLSAQDQPHHTSVNSAERGYLYVPYKFVVPLMDPRWPVPLQGMKLGVHFCKIRNKGIFSEIRQELEDMGYDLTVKKRVLKGTQNEGRAIDGATDSVADSATENTMDSAEGVDESATDSATRTPARAVKQKISRSSKSETSGTAAKAE